MYSSWQEPIRPLFLFFIIISSPVFIRTNCIVSVSHNLSIGICSNLVGPAFCRGTRHVGLPSLRYFLHLSPATRFFLYSYTAVLITSCNIPVSYIIYLSYYRYDCASIQSFSIGRNIHLDFSQHLKSIIFIVY